MITRTQLHGYTAANRSQHHRLLSGLPLESDLALRLRRCGSLSNGTHGWLYRCRLPPCSGCRAMYATRHRRKASEMFLEAENDEMAFVTVVLGIVGSLADMDALLSKGRRDLRNAVNARRAARAAWGNVELLGWFEVDAVHSDDLQFLAKDRRALLASLGAGVGIDGPIWVATFHAVVRHERIDWQEVRSVLAAQWPLSAQVDVQPFHRHLNPTQNLANCVNYAVKHQAVTKLGTRSEPWPVTWLADYYTWLHDWSPSFKRLRILLRRRKKAKRTIVQVNVRQVEVEPMPWMSF